MVTNELPLSFACWDYDRMKALQDGRVRPEGIALNFLPLSVEETFFRQLRFQEFDVAEMSLSSYVLTLNEPEPPFVAIPVFPSRFFRHQSMYVNTASGIERPQDLAGKRVGIPEYQMTASVWQRGLLADDYGVPVSSMRYFTGGIEQPGRSEKIQLDLPPEIEVTPIGPEQTLSRMLVEGELDAVFSASAPSTFGQPSEHGDGRVTHLFPDFVQVEQDYYRRTGIFPIMHTVVIKRSVHERHPWIARSLTKALNQSLEHAYEDLMRRNALKVMLPWLQEHLRETTEVLGDRYWDYGLEPNRKVLETFLRYSHDQGLANRELRPEELFVPSALEGFKV